MVPIDIKPMIVKYEYEESIRPYYSGELLKKIAMTIRNPFSAFGLLIDNSFNLSASSISIEVKN